MQKSYYTSISFTNILKNIYYIHTSQSKYLPFVSCGIVSSLEGNHSQHPCPYTSNLCRFPHPPFFCHTHYDTNTLFCCLFFFLLNRISLKHRDLLSFKWMHSIHYVVVPYFKQFLSMNMQLFILISYSATMNNYVRIRWCI